MTSQKCNIPECYCHKVLTAEQKKAFTQTSKTCYPRCPEEMIDRGNCYCENSQRFPKLPESTYNALNALASAVSKQYEKNTSNQQTDEDLLHSDSNDYRERYDNVND